MGRQIRQDIVLDGEAARREAESFGRSLEDIGKRGEKAFNKTGSAIAGMASGGVFAAMASQAAAAWSAVTEPALSTFAQILDKAQSFRKETTMAAIGAGMEFDKMKTTVQGLAEQTGLMPQRVDAYAGSVSQVTGNWQSAANAVDAYYSRSLKLGKNLEDMKGINSTLENMFGIEDSARVKSFFAGADAGAAALGQNFRKLDIQSASLLKNLAMISSSTPEQLSAVNATFLKGNKGNVEKASTNEQGVVSWIKNKEEYIARSMVRAGKLKKTEDFWDEEGNIKDLPGAIAFEADKQRGFVAKNKGGRRILAQNMGGRQTAAALLNYRGDDYHKAFTAEKNASDLDALDAFLATPAGKRTVSDAKKENADVNAGLQLLPAQDAAVKNGGGWKGIALNGAGTGLKYAGGALLTHQGVKVGLRSAPTLLRVAQQLPRLGPYGLMAGAAVGIGVGTYYAAGENERQEAAQAAERDDARRQGFTSASSLRFHRGRYSLSGVAGAKTETGKADIDHPIRLTMYNEPLPAERPTAGKGFRPAISSSSTEDEDARRQGFSSVAALRFSRGRFSLPRAADAQTDTGQADLNHPIRLGLAREQPAPAPKELVAKLSPADIKAFGQEVGNVLAGKTLKVEASAGQHAPRGARAPG